MIIKNKFFKIILLVLLFILIGILFLIVDIYSFTDIDERQKVDAIVVMGASQWKGVPSPVFENRLDHTFDLYKQRYAENIILTGGVGEGEIFSESQIGRDYLVDKGVASENIFIEEIGRTSFQSLREVQEILENRDFKTLLLVSDGFHMKRLKKMSDDLGLKTYFSATPRNSISKLSELRYVFREAFVYVIYLFAGI